MPEFLRCGGFYFAVAVRHSQLHVGETLVNNMQTSIFVYLSQVISLSQY